MVIHIRINVRMMHVLRVVERAASPPGLICGFYPPHQISHDDVVAVNADAMTLMHRLLM